MFYYSRDRTGEHPERHLQSYGGILQADAYAGFNRLYDGARKPSPLLEAACWSHSRRKFFVLADVTARARGKPSVIAPLALEAVKRIDAIFAIEREINGRPAEERLAVRRARTAPLVSDLEAWMRNERGKLSRHSEVAKAMDYMLKRWAAFTRFLADGRICLTNNAAERELRGIALGRKAWLFAGSDEGASWCSSHHVIDRSKRFFWSASGGGRRDRRTSAWRRISCRSRSASRMIQGAPLQGWVAGSMPSAMRRRMVVVLIARTAAASLSVTSPRSTRSPSR